MATLTTLGLVPATAAASLLLVITFPRWPVKSIATRPSLSTAESGSGRGVGGIRGLLLSAVIRFCKVIKQKLQTFGLSPPLQKVPGLEGTNVFYCLCSRGVPHSAIVVNKNKINKKYEPFRIRSCWSLRWLQIRFNSISLDLMLNIQKHQWRYELFTTLCVVGVWTCTRSRWYLEIYNTKSRLMSPNWVRRTVFWDYPHMVSTCWYMYVFSSAMCSFKKGLVKQYFRGFLGSVGRVAGADPGEMKWVNFHPPFPSPLLSFFLSLKY